MVQQPLSFCEDVDNAQTSYKSVKNFRKYVKGNDNPQWAAISYCMYYHNFNIKADAKVNMLKFDCSICEQIVLCKDEFIAAGCIFDFVYLQTYKICLVIVCCAYIDLDHRIPEVLFKNYRLLSLKHIYGILKFPYGLQL